MQLIIIELICYFRKISLLESRKLLMSRNLVKTENSTKILG